MTPDDSDRGQMTKPGNRGLKRLALATKFSILGYKAAWRNEEAFRTEIMMALFLFPAAFWLGQTAVERVLLLMSCILVILMELANSAIESVVDRTGSEHHPLSGQAKDLGSALVMTANLTVLLVWGLIAWERFAG